MDTRDVLNIFLIFSIFTITACVVFVSYFFVQALKAVTNLTEHLKNSTEGLKNKLSLKALAAVPSIFIALMARLLKRGR